MPTLTPDQRRLVDRAGDLKQRLVDFATSPPLERQLRAITREVTAAAPDDRDPFTLGVQAVERLLFEFAYDDGSTVLERFAARHSLDPEDRALVERFADGVYGLFEVVEPGTETIRVRSSFDDLEYDVTATLPGVLETIDAGSFVRGRILPVADVWILSGTHEILPPSSRPDVADVVMNTLLTHPHLTHGNPELKEAAVRQTEEQHERFVGLYGDEVVVRASADEVGEAYARMLERPDHEPEVRARQRRMALDMIADAPFDADRTVALFSHPAAGVSFCVGYGEVAAALVDSRLAEDPDRVQLVGDYLDDESIPPWVIERLVRDAGPAADHALQVVLGRPDFTWAAHGAALLEERKPSYVSQPILPPIAVMPSLVREVHGSAAGRGA